MKIRLFRGRSLAPGCYIIARERPDGSFDERDEPNTILVQTDYDFPSVATTFGWSLAYDGGVMCEHEGTDGTIDCPSCNRSVGAFIQGASDWLDAHEGAETQDPGYFAGHPDQAELAI